MESVCEGEEIIEQKYIKENGDSAVRKFKKGKFLGKGGFAKCYEGILLETKKKFAIKVIEKNSLQRSRAKQKLLSQIKIQKALHHPHIVQFDSVFEDQLNVYIVLELCVNKTVSEMVKARKKLTMKEVKYFMRQIISAIEYMHSNRVIHRDLKMGNIFIDHKMDLKVGDFGLATKLQFFDEKKRTMCGTPNYIAPEIVEGQMGHSYQVDIWSTGVICYALLFGRPPFQTNEIKMTYKKIKNCDYSFPSSGVSEEAKDFIRKILVLDPKKRLSIKEMLSHQFLFQNDLVKQLPTNAIMETPVLSRYNTQRQDRRSLIKKSLEKKKIFQSNPSSTSRFYSPRSINSKVQLQGCLSSQLANLQSQNKNLASSPISEHRIRVLAHVDYSKKYGLGYLINNRYYGVYFNDQTLMSTTMEKKIIYYIQSPASKKQKIDVYQVERLPNDHIFQKKYLLMNRFIGELNQEVSKMPEDKVVYQKQSKLIYMKQWLKTRHAIMFGLNNKMFQVNFFDKSCILLNTEYKTIHFTNKKNETFKDTLNNAMKNSDTELTRRIQYMKEILNSIKQKKDDGSTKGDDHLE